MSPSTTGSLAPRSPAPCSISATCSASTRSTAPSTNPCSCGCSTSTAMNEALGRANGRRGAQKLREVLADPGHLEGPLPNEGTEERFFALCRAHGLPKPLVHQEPVPTAVETLEVDFLWPEQALIVEIDSRDWHSTARKRIARCLPRSAARAGRLPRAPLQVGTGGLRATQGSPTRFAAYSLTSFSIRARLRSRTRQAPERARPQEPPPPPSTSSRTAPRARASEAAALLEAVSPATLGGEAPAHLIGVTGPPGAGKSSLLSALVRRGARRGARSPCSPWTPPPSARAARCWATARASSTTRATRAC